jgi:murein DD-endopeptidase MepM/ murein hydrolase activator NlpD
MSDFDSLINNLIGENINSSKKETNIQQNKIEVYKFPIKNGVIGKNIDSGEDKPNLIGYFSPNAPTDIRHSHHDGIDQIGKPNESLFPLASGQVLETGTFPKSGNYIKIGYEPNEKGFGVVSFFAHCNSIFAKKGDKVTQTTPVASCGNSGNARTTTSHVHLEVRVNNTLVDPLSIMGKIVGSLTQQSPAKQSISSIINFWNNLVKEF